MGKLRIMGAEGDRSIGWDEDNPDEVRDASKTFEEMIKKGYRAYRMTKDRSKGKSMENFDPSAENILFVPPMTGG
jgi:hypothetical protein